MDGLRLPPVWMGSSPCAPAMGECWQCCCCAGEIGEHPVGVPNNLMPYIQQVALGQREALSVYGTNYNTRDGTAVRDYIHVVDLADGHTKALTHLFGSEDTFCKAINLGTGVGSTVLEMVHVRSANLLTCLRCAVRGADVGRSHHFSSVRRGMSTVQTLVLCASVSKALLASRMHKGMHHCRRCVTGL